GTTRQWPDWRCRWRCPAHRRSTSRVRSTTGYRSGRLQDLSCLPSQQRAGRLSRGVVQSQANERRLRSVRLEGPPGTTTRAVMGHDFGLNLTVEEKRALIAFLKTL